MHAGSWLTLIVLAAFGSFSIGCAPGSGAEAGAMDAPEGRCVAVVLPPGAAGGCDGHSEARCSQLALVATQGTTLVPYARCHGTGCAWADDCTIDACTCAGRTCGAGEICARTATAATPECVRCDPSDI